MADDRGKGISLDIRPPLPTRGIRVTSSDIFGLEAFEFLLVAKLVGLVLRTAELARVRDLLRIARTKLQAWPLTMAAIQMQ